MTTEIPPIIDRYLAELTALCKEFGVERLEVFGSVVTGEFDPLLSDIDILVTYPSDYDYGPWLGRFFDLQERLADLFGRRVDLVMAKEFRNPYFGQSVNETRRTVFDALTSGELMSRETYRM
jgi:predicted nucleotidyltransferase